MEKRSHETKGNVVSIGGDFNNRYKFIMLPVWTDWGTDSSGRVLKKQVASIALKDKVNDVYIIHSDFIIGLESKWRTRKFNTQRKHASNIVNFLNYLIEIKHKFAIKKISDIDLSIGTSFLNNLTDNNAKKGTVLEARRTLTYFYLWLLKIECLPKVNHEIFEAKKRESNYATYYESVFNERVPGHTAIKKEHCLPLKYIPLFFEIAIEYGHPIVLGLYLQFFGGLRSGEVINLSRTQFKRRVNQENFVLNIKERDYRTDIRDSGASGVKKRRYQTILQFKDWAEILYKEHNEFYGTKDKEHTGALFINRDGRPMSGKSYHQYFYKVKREFIKFLIRFGDAEAKLVANHLRLTDWGTHIGRGTFTNLAAEETDNVLELAFLRGDRDFTSALPYLARTEQLFKKIQAKLSEVHTQYIPSLLKN